MDSTFTAGGERRGKRPTTPQLIYAGLISVSVVAAGMAEVISSDAVIGLLSFLAGAAMQTGSVEAVNGRLEALHSRLDHLPPTQLEHSRDP